MYWPTCWTCPSIVFDVVANDVGGGFGAKSSLYQEELTICAVTRLLGRPVKWISDRREDLMTSTQAWDEVVEAELALCADGTIVGLRAEVTSDIGAYSIYPWTATVEPVQVISFLPGAYRVPHYRGRTQGVATCKAPTGPYRGVGRPITSFVMEGLMEPCGPTAGQGSGRVTPTELYRPEDFPYKTPSGIVWDEASLIECMEKARAALRYEATRWWQRQAQAEGRWIGIGFATYVELTGIGSSDSRLPRDADLNRDRSNTCPESK